MSQVSVSIGGKIYRMACDDGQETHLEKLAGRLDQEVERLRREFGVVGEQRLMVMAAIKALDALSEAEVRAGRLEAEAGRLRASEASVQARITALDVDFANRVNEMATAVEAVASRFATLNPAPADQRQ